MNVQRRSILRRTVQTGLPAWSGSTDTGLVLSESLSACDRFFYRAFGDCTLPVMIYDDQGVRLLNQISADENQKFSGHIQALRDRVNGPSFIWDDTDLIYVYDQLDRWPDAPEEVAYVAIRVTADWFDRCTGLDLTPSEFTLVGLLLSGHDLASAAAQVDATYDTKRKQIRQVFAKAEVTSQSALLRELSLALSSYILEDLLQPNQSRPEVSLAQRVFGRDVVIHSISIGDYSEIPVWEFGARRGQPLLYFHSMLAPVMFTSDMVAQLKAHNIRLLMIPRHFFVSKAGKGTPQRQILQATAEVVEYFFDEPVICLGESAGCAWAAQFTRHYPDHVSEVIFAATPQAVRPEDAARTLSKSASLLNEVSTHIRRDERVIAGLTRIYNTIARVPAVARRSLEFMLRHAPSDQASINASFETIALGDWVRLIANKAARSSIDEVSHLQSDWVKSLHHIERPMRFFHGADDTLCPIADAKAMVDGLPDARFTAFEDAGHLVLGQRLDKILGALFADQKSNENVTAQSVAEVS
jgi:pimeloyl-ACP methyl ester carboxylesterase/DNA-binding CsgD family transcriptional regulator